MKYYYKKRYTGYDYVPYYPDSVCISYGHTWQPSDGDGYTCTECGMGSQEFKDNTREKGND